LIKKKLDVLVYDEWLSKEELVEVGLKFIKTRWGGFIT